MARIPLWPSIITLRIAAAVGAIRAMRLACPVSARCLTHSAPALVLPNPRPAIRNHRDQSPSGGRWVARARGCSLQSPGGRPHGHVASYHAYRARSTVTASTLGFGRASNWRQARSTSARCSGIGLLIQQ